MFILRLVLLAVLFAETAWLSWHTPWQAHASLAWHAKTEVTRGSDILKNKQSVDGTAAVTDILNRDVPLAAPLSDAPFFRPPPRPELKVFGGRISPFIDPQTVDITISVDRVRLYQRFAGIVVGTFFLFGVIGYFLTSRPRPADVAYSLALTTGFIAGSIASAIASQMTADRGPLPWLNLFWAAGVGIAFVITVTSRRRFLSA